MIDPKELRIGNWLLCDNRFVKVDAICDYPNEKSKQISASSEQMGVHLEFERFNPIKLSHDILLACGFVEYNDNPFWKNQEYKYYATGREGESFPISLSEDGVFRKYFACDDDEYSWFGLPITALHELQNYFHTIMKQELSIDISKIK